MGLARTISSTPRTTVTTGMSQSRLMPSSRPSSSRIPIAVKNMPKVRETRSGE
jgi:hypothetical protein